MGEDEGRVKRSRFDQREPEPRKTSRFDRRSRSPSRRTDRIRSRSPVSKGPRSPKSEKPRAVADPAAAAAAAAAKINAELQARKGIQHADVPPIRSTASPLPKSSSPPTEANLNGEVYIADGDYIKDIEVNDLRNRYTLTKGATQKLIKEETGADVTTRGSYYPDKSMATAASPPLYLHITSTTKAGLEKAVAKIEELMQQELPNLVDERRFRRREPDQFERDEFGRRKWPEERIPIDMETVPGFNLRAQVVGHGGSYVKHIQQETRCRVQIKGRGSGFMEHSTGAESDEPMYLHVTGPDPKEVQKAKELCEDLLGNVRESYERFKANPPPQRMESYTDGYGANANSSSSYGNRDYGGRGSYGGRDRDNYNRDARDNNYSNAAAYSPTSATPAAPGTAQSQSAADYAAQYPQMVAQGQDPYAAYGGYQNYLAYYEYYAQQAAQQGQGQAAATAPGNEGAGAAAPPPPPGSAAGAPPPPPGGTGSYGAVPPPPGL